MSPDWVFVALLACVIFVGAAVQKLVGIGFALVALPALVLFLGPAEAVIITNCAGAMVSAIGLLWSWRRVRLGQMTPLVVASACTVPAGAWVADRLPEEILLVGMGLLVSVAVILIIRGLRLPLLGGVRGAVAAGAASGFMNSSAGVGGPAVSLYAVNAGWTVREFVPNAQFYGLLVNLLSIAVKGVPQLSAPSWSLIAGGILLGTVAGSALAARTPEEWARRIVLALALCGGLSTVLKGLWQL